uniref:Transcription initiation factor IIA gamma subunit C-terminal domain-containing protein n=1 Tax=Lactuca sativa TaxID=4236 RepID=A0A9R1W347_LACSA|nr:hypothetical protein LSAT_V11C300147420 [Lactuca sativa]
MIGCLTETLDEMVLSGILGPELAIQVLVYVKSMDEALDNQVKTKVSIKGHLHTYRFYDNVWTFILLGSVFSYFLTQSISTIFFSYTINTFWIQLFIVFILHFPSRPSNHTTLLEKQPFTTCNVCHKTLRRRANACQGRPCHNERRHAFVRRLFTTRIYDAHL